MAIRVQRRPTAREINTSMVKKSKKDAPRDLPRSSSEDVAEGAAGRSPTDPQVVLLVGVMLGAVFIVAYWRTLGILVGAWNAHEDYLHGYLVPFLSALMLWVRRDEFPGWGNGFAWPGLLLILLAVAMRIAGAKVNIDAIQGWSIIPWVAGVFWLIGGWKVCVWAAPAVAFLWFMVPLPFKVEQSLRWELQRVVTSMSCWVLQLLGEPALAQGNVVVLPSKPLEVAEACSGMRIFMGVFAFAVAFVILFRRSWWERGLLLASVIPVALLANTMRIVVLALLTEHVSPECGNQAHEPMKLIMVVFAALMLGLVLFYLGRLFKEVEDADVGAIVRRSDI
ncbi:MAG: exosortase/archaeosortase family protein [Pirellulales bacterium]|nr:exosortase/archaeosortase family protein [Pirellulales bacterium]